MNGARPSSTEVLVEIVRAAIVEARMLSRVGARRVGIRCAVIGRWLLHRWLQPLLRRPVVLRVTFGLAVARPQGARHDGRGRRLPAAGLGRCRTYPRCLLHGADRRSGSRRLPRRAQSSWRVRLGRVGLLHGEADSSPPRPATSRGTEAASCEPSDTGPRPGGRPAIEHRHLHGERLASGREGKRRQPCLLPICFLMS